MGGLSLEQFNNKGIDKKFFRVNSVITRVNMLEVKLAQNRRKYNPQLRNGILIADLHKL